MPSSCRAHSTRYPSARRAGCSAGKRDWRLSREREYHDRRDATAPRNPPRLMGVRSGHSAFGFCGRLGGHAHVRRPCPREVLEYKRPLHHDGRLRRVRSPGVLMAHVSCISCDLKGHETEVELSKGQRFAHMGSPLRSHGVTPRGSNPSRTLGLLGRFDAMPDPRGFRGRIAALGHTAFVIVSIAHRTCATWCAGRGRTRRRRRSPSAREPRTPSTSSRSQPAPSRTRFSGATQASTGPAPTAASPTARRRCGAVIDRRRSAGC